MNNIPVWLLCLYVIATNVWTSGCKKNTNPPLPYYIKGFHDDPVLNSIDSLNFLMKFKEAEKMAEEALNWRYSESLKLKSLLLWTSAQNQVPQNELLNEVLQAQPQDSIERYFKARAVSHYYYQFEPKMLDIRELRSFLNAGFLNEYYKAAIEIKSAEVLLLHFTNPRLIRSLLESAENKLSSFYKYTYLHYRLYRSQALVYNAQRQKEFCLLACEKIKDFDRYIFVPSDEFKAAVHNFTGLIYRYHSDIDGLKHEIEQSKTYLKGDSCTEGWHMLLFNQLLVHMGRNDKGSKDSFEQVYKTSLKLKSDCGKLQSNIALMKGMHLARIGESLSAIPYLYEAINFENSARHPNTTLRSIAVNMLFSAYLSMNKFKEAEETVMLDSEYTGTPNRDSLIKYIDQTQFFPFHFFINLIEIDFEKYLHTGDIQALYNALKLVRKINRDIYTQYDVTDEDAIIKFFDDHGQRFFETGLKTLYELYQYSKDTMYLREFIGLAERHTNVTLGRDLKLKRSGFKLPKTLQQEELSIISEVKEYKRYGKFSSDSENPVERYAAFQSRLREEYPEYFTEALIKDSIDLQTVMGNLGKTGSCILKLDVVKNTVFRTYIDSKVIQISPLDFNEEDRSRLNEFYQILSENKEISPEDFQQQSHLLYRWMFSGLNQNMIPSKILYIPSAIFNLINPEVLIYRENKDPHTFADLHYLIHKHELIFSPGLSFMTMPPESSGDIRQVTAFSFTGKNEKPGQHAHLTALKGTYEEVKQLSNSFPKANIYTGKEANLKNFRDLSQKSKPNILHLALHGFAASNERDDVKLYFREGYSIDSLTGYELLNMNVSSDLLVLSACQSTAGQIHDSEGIYSLTRYFMINDIPNILSSIWNMDDNTSSMIFNTYYKLPYKSKIQNGSGLTEIKRELSRKPLHPYYIFGLVRYSMHY